jgi:rhodanese-related sulfurtransferase
MHEITIEQLDDLISNHEYVVIVDVREREECARGRVPGALIVPLGSLEHAVDEGSIACNTQLLEARTETVVVCCDDGRRSRVAAAQLAQRGFTTVYWLSNGLKQWQAEGFPLVTD